VTGADFTGVDIDLLADYLGGTLAGTPDQARVTALIADDPVWRDAHEQLSGAMAEVGDVLHAWGAEPEPMPAELAARLESTFEQMGGPAGAFGSSAPGVRDNVVDLQLRRERRARLRKSSFAVAAVVMMLAGAGTGVAYLRRDSATSSANSASSAGLAETKSQARLPADQIVSSGTDYTVENLRAAADAATPTVPKPGVVRSPAKSTPPTGGVMSAGGLAGTLTRLRPIAALQECLDAVGVENQAGPIDMQSVDYARFQGKAALVMRFSAANGTWAWVSGPRCGLPGAGADTTYSAQVG
jgi:hypothetical protein